MDWAKEFELKLKTKELARQETKKNFHMYETMTLRLFDEMERKIKKIPSIQIHRYIMAQTESIRPQLKALQLTCFDKRIEFTPEGINLDDSKGTIRIRHNSKNVNKFCYLHLIIDPHSTASYPDNLIWVINENSSQPFERLPPFDDRELEYLVERIFLE